jgi:DNA replication and repair protein RecF
MAYNKALSHRNLLLKSFWINRNFDQESLAVWDDQLVRYGNTIYQSRQQFITDFMPIFQRYYSLISKDKEQVELAYRSQLHAGDFTDLLQENMAKDRGNHYSNIGIHKDDLTFNLGGLQLKKFGSQGQQKTYLLALKLAQAELIQNISKDRVTILLDDIYDKLDDRRMAQLMGIVGGGDFGQVFITDTNLDRIPGILSKENINFKSFKIEKGAVENV